MKMSKKVREYKAGDFIFAKVKGYPAWPARVQRPNGKKYFVYFYGTGETANLAPNMIFDYAENKDKFLSKAVKRRDFNDGVKQIEHDFANNVPLEQVIGVAMEVSEETANDTANDSTTNDTIDESTADTTAAEDTTVADESTVNTTSQNETMVEDSDDPGTLVIDEGKKGRKSTTKPTGKETPKPVKEAKTPRGKKKEEAEESKEDDKKEEEIVSRSGRKIRPKRYIDEQTEDNATLPSPAPKKRRGASPAPDKVEEKTDKIEPKAKGKQFNTVTQSELEDLKEPFASDITNNNRILQVRMTSINQENSQQIVSMPVNEIVPRFDSTKIASNDTNISINSSISVAKPRKFVPPTKARPKSIDYNQNNNDSSHVDKIGNVEKTLNASNFIETVDNCIHGQNYFNEEITGTNRVDNNFGNNNRLNNNDVLYNSEMVVSQDDLYDKVSNDFINNINKPENTFAFSDNYNISDDFAHLDVYNNNEFDNLNKPIALHQVDKDFSTNIINSKFERLDNNSKEFINNEHLSNKSRNNDKTKFALDGLILGSLNVLNESTSFTENVTQISNKSNNSSIVNISRNESFASVTTLNKTYKNLDLKSFENRENLRAIEINNHCEELISKKNNNSDNSSMHKIPKGDDYFNLFKISNNRRNKSKKYVAMSTEFGDMGFNIKYSDYIKQYGNYYEDCEEYEDITRKILHKYPNENRIRYDRLINK